MLDSLCALLHVSAACVVDGQGHCKLFLIIAVSGEATPPTRWHLPVQLLVTRSGTTVVLMMTARGAPADKTTYMVFPGGKIALLVCHSFWALEHAMAARPAQQQASTCCMPARQLWAAAAASLALLKHWRFHTQVTCCTACFFAVAGLQGILVSCQGCVVLACPVLCLEPTDCCPSLNSMAFHSSVAVSSSSLRSASNR